MTSETASWKQKVDPAFPDFIKFYLEFLAITDLPGNKGYLALDDRNLKTLEVATAIINFLQTAHTEHDIMVGLRQMRKEKKTERGKDN
jgi:hypothetical protein